ncbi:hypothetical protein C0J52_11053 [Blattella germanica]|nr:hypothetical protein C0J52_11053 [Blattella germanica]
MHYFITFFKKLPLKRNMTTLPSAGAIHSRHTAKMYLVRFSEFTQKYPLTRGMITYSIIWPISNLCQQTITGRKELDFLEAVRFCIYGSCFVAPTLYAWLRLAANMWPQLNLRSAVTKGIVEQFSYTPFAMTCFYFIMSLLEGKTVRRAAHEVEVKFIPTYQVGALVWPVLQTINYTLVAEKNRVVYVGMCSLMWTCFLAYMKQLEAEKLAAERLLKKKLLAAQRRRSKSEIQ